MAAKDTPSADEAAQQSIRIESEMSLGLGLLYQALQYAGDASADLWDFALEVHELERVGLTISDLRWLVAKGYVKHGCEKSIYGDAHRSFEPCRGFSFTRTSCLVLTQEGAQFAKSLHLDRSRPSESASPIPSVANGENESYRSTLVVATPSWDSTRRELRVANKTVKRFRVPAPNQETILGVFEEEKWPKQIDDPLPVCGSIDPQTRLHDAINRLNGCQVHPLIRFHGNGNGRAVSWEIKNLSVSSRG